MEENQKINQNVVPNESEKQEIWISCLVSKTPKGYSIWIPAGAFK